MYLDLYESNLWLNCYGFLKHKIFGGVSPNFSAFGSNRHQFVQPQPLVPLFWIDLVCIIQDDLNDWRKESVLMSTLYGSSSLNIAATAAPDGRVGCLFERDLVYIRGGSSRNRQRAADTWLEQMLAPRSLHFGVSQLFWQCGTKYACKTFPYVFPKLLYTRRYYRSKQNLWESWEEIVAIYSGCLLIYRRDKTVALAGIARKFQERTGDRYFAGLWRKEFPTQLCWRSSSRTNSLGWFTRPTERRVLDSPSWSW